jgi:hypothetical protein
MDSKVCRKCKKEKNVSEFYRHHKNPEKNSHSWCKRCTCDYALDQQKNRSKEKQSLINRRNKIKAAFGITLEQFDEILLSQNGGCAICNTKTPGGKGNFHVDHCHSTGRIRGLLCHHCNVGLGHFRDSPSLLVAAAQYVEGEL